MYLNIFALIIFIFHWDGVPAAANQVSISHPSNCKIPLKNEFPRFFPFLFLTSSQEEEKRSKEWKRGEGRGGKVIRNVSEVNSIC